MLGAFLLAAFSGTSAVTARAQKMPQPAQTAAATKSFLDKHCLACHNDRTRTAGLTFDHAALDQVGANADAWEKVVRKLRTRAMPPAGRPRPDESAYEDVIGWLESELDRHSSPASIPVGPAFHRLNRTEYANAVRDLLGVPIEAEALLPADDASFGFDNIAEVLTVSP